MANFYRKFPAASLLSLAQKSVFYRYCTNQKIYYRCQNQIACVNSDLNKLFDFFKRFLGQYLQNLSEIVIMELQEM